MTNYIVRRVILNLFVIYLVGSLIFVLVRLLPGSFIIQRSGLDLAGLTEERIALAKAELGLDKSIGEQYVTYWADLLRLDFGFSFETRHSVVSELADAVPYSFELGVGILLVGLTISIPVGIISAVRQDEWQDYLLRGFAIVALSFPVFWTAALITIANLNFGSPLRLEVIAQPHVWEDPWAAIQWYIIPSFCGGIAGTASIMRVLRSELLEVLRQDYIRTAHSKGLAESTVILRHALQNAFLPVLTLIGLTLASLITGQIILESMFNIPGVGRELIEAISLRDYSMVQGIVVMVASVIVFTNLIVDISYGYLDPRVRFS